MPVTTAADQDILNAYRAKQTPAAATTPKSSSDNATASLTEDYSTFIKMLTTQLQNQDPLQPMDSAQFTQQLVAFSGVEQQITANKNLEQLISLQQTNGAVTLLGFIGKKVEIASENLVKTGTASEFSYTLANIAQDVSVQIKDKDGKVIRTLDVPSAGNMGRHDVVWDGKNNGGVLQPNGTYTVAVTAKDKDGKGIASTVTTSGIVDGVEATSTGGVLSVGDQQVDLSKIISITQPPAVTAAAA